MKIAVDTGRTFIVSYNTLVKKDAFGKNIWADEEQGIAEMRNVIAGVTFYEPNDSEGNSFCEVTLTPHQIDELHKAIEEIRNQDVKPKQIDW